MGTFNIESLYLDKKRFFISSWIDALKFCVTLVRHCGASSFFTKRESERDTKIRVVGIRKRHLYCASPRRPIVCYTRHLSSRKGKERKKKKTRKKITIPQTTFHRFWRRWGQTTKIESLSITVRSKVKVHVSLQDLFVCVCMRMNMATKQGCHVSKWVCPLCR